jgi:hypothetical protein
MVVLLLLSNTVQNAIIRMRMAVSPGAIALCNRGHPR